MRPRIPIWVAALGEKNVAMTAEVADGWLPIFFVPDKAKEVFGPSLAAGTAKRDPSLDTLQIAAGGIFAIGEESEVAGMRDLGRAAAALYIGGMGAKGKNFYNALAVRYGYEKEAAEIQDLYLSGKKAEAAALVPSDLLEATSLCGPESYLKERARRPGRSRRHAPQRDSGRGRPGCDDREGAQLGLTPRWQDG